VPLDAGTWDEHVGSVAGLYGANASGKSNVLQALLFMRIAVLRSHRRWDPDDGVPVEPFLLDPKFKDEPSLFEVQVLLDGMRYQYGFRATSEAIVGEWLYVYPGSRRQMWFERDINADDEFAFGKNFGGRNRTISQLTRSNSLFLSTAIANNHKRLAPLYHWFDQHLRSVSPGNRNARTDYTVGFFEKNPKRWAEVSQMMQFADLGIEDIRVRHEDIPQDAQQSLRSLYETVSGNESFTMEGGGRNADEFFEKMSRVVEVAHHSSAARNTVFLPFSKESLGTQIWFALIGPVLRVLANADTLLVDELDASLHPRLTAEILRMFRDPVKNPKQAQIIFTTHDTTLLGTLLAGRELLRDQVWFTEKDDEGATTLYPLTDFSPRKAENLERGYLQGRYGAVPVLDDRILLKVFDDLGYLPATDEGEDENS